MRTALLISLTVHALLLLLRFDVPGVGLPGVRLPWGERRMLAPDIAVVLAPTDASRAAPRPEPAPPVPAPASTPAASTRPPNPPSNWNGLRVELRDAAVDQPSQSRPVPPRRVTTAPKNNAGAKTVASATPPVVSASPLRRRSPRPVPALTKPTAVIAQANPQVDSFRVPPPVAAAASGPPMDLPRPADPLVRPIPYDEELTLRDRLAKALETADRELTQRAQEAELQLQESLRQEAQRNEAVRQEAQRVEAARQEAQRQEVLRREELRQEAERQEAQRQEVLRQEGERQEALQREARQQEAQRRETLRQETLRQETLRQEALRQEAERREAQRQDASRREAQQQEAQRQEVLRQESLRQEAERREAQRQDALRREAQLQEVQRQEAQRQEAQRQEAQAAAQQKAAEERAAADRAERQTRQQAEQQAAEQAASRAREGARTGADSAVGATAPARGSGPESPKVTQSPAPGNSAAAQRPIDSVAAAPQPAQRSAAPPERIRRRTIIGRTETDIVAMMYAEKWRQRVELNAAFDLLKQAKTGPYENPVVTVALRSDGTVEGVTINRSSGVPEIDRAVRTIVMSLSPYPAFPRDLAMDYDVVEIRRVWSFDTALRLFSGGR